MALLRVLVGPSCSSTCGRSSSTPRRGRIYRDMFNQPYASWYPELPRALYVAVLWVGVARRRRHDVRLFAHGSRRRRCRCRRLQPVPVDDALPQQPRLPLIVLAALAVMPCGRELSVDSWWRPSGRPALPTTSPAWPLWLLRFEAATVYGASGLSKLARPDWFGGDGHVAPPRAGTRPAGGVGAAELGVDVLADRSFHTVVAKLIVATELFIAVGLWSRRTRYAAVWIAVCFHVAIELSAQVEVFSYLAIAALVIWAVPSTRDRVVLVDPSSRRHTAGPVRSGRSTGWPGSASSTAARRAADGRRPRRDRSSTGSCGGRASSLSRLPLTAWLALPTLLVRRRSRAAASSAGRRTASGLREPMAAPPRTAGAVRRGGLARRHRRDVRRAGPAGALPGGRPRRLNGRGHGRRRVVHAQPGRRRHMAVRVRRGDRHDLGRLQHRPPRRGDDGPVPGGHGGHPRRPRERRPWRAWIRQHLVEHDGWTALRLRRTDGRRCDALFVAGLVERRLPRVTQRRQADPLAGPVPGRPDRAVGRGHRAVRQRGEAAEGRQPLEVLHRRGVLGARPAPPAVPRGGLGCHRRPGRQLPGDQPGRGGGPLAARARPLGRVRAGRDRRVPRARPRPAADRRPSSPTPAARRRCSPARCAGSASRPGRGASSVRGTHVPRGGGYGVVGEALTGLWRTAEVDDRLAEVRAPLAERATCIAGLAMDVQHVGDEAAAAASPPCRRRLVHRRRDAHGRPAARHLGAAADRGRSSRPPIPVAEQDVPSGVAVGAGAGRHVQPGVRGVRRCPARVRPSGPHRRRSVGRWGAVVLLAAGRLRAGARRPRRVAAGGAHRGRHRRRRRRDRSDGATAALARAGDVRTQGGRSCPSPCRSSPRRARCCWRSAGADLGARHAALRAALVAVVVLTAVTAILPADGPGRRVCTWVGRLVSAAGVVACILLVVDGVYDV